MSTGTGDLAITLSRVKGASILGVDPALAMLERAESKIQKKDLTGHIQLLESTAEKLPLVDQSFDVATVAFGVRNFSNLNKGLKSLNRVLKPGGHIFILEFGWPQWFPLKPLYHFYLSKWIPLVGGWISGDREAYQYLYESVKAFPKGDEFLKHLEKAGFENTAKESLSGGIVYLYSASKV